MSIYRVEPYGNRWPNRAAASREARKIAKREGGETRVINEDTGKVVISFRHQGLSGKVKSSRGNPSRRLTKTQRKARTKKLSAKRRVANALKAYLQKANPGRKLAGAKVQKNKGSITIVPVFLKKRK